MIPTIMADNRMLVHKCRFFSSAIAATAALTALRVTEFPPRPAQPRTDYFFPKSHSSTAVPSNFLVGRGHGVGAAPRLEIDWRYVVEITIKFTAHLKRTVFGQPEESPAFSRPRGAVIRFTNSLIHKSVDRLQEGPSIVAPTGA